MSASSHIPPPAGLRKLMDEPLRDPSVCRATDGYYYLTGTSEPFWENNHTHGIRVWRSPDLFEWQALGTVWRCGESPWHKPYLLAGKPLWAPEIHYYEGTFWLTYSMPGWDNTAKTSGSGLLRSSTGQPDGPYEDMHPHAPLGDEIDASLFHDTDGTLYFLWHSGKIAPLTTDRRNFAEPAHWIQTTVADPDPGHHSDLCAGIFGENSFNHIGFEGVFVFKRENRYYVSCSEGYDGRYSCMLAESDHLFGPYHARYEAIPYGGHNTFFQDEEGSWWSTYFGEPWYQRPAILPVSFETDGRLILRAKQHK